MNLIQSPQYKDNFILNDRLIPYAAVDGTLFLPIRPFCDMLGLKYPYRYKRLLQHPVLHAQVQETQVTVYGSKKVETTPSEDTCGPQNVTQVPQKDHFQGPALQFQKRNMVTLPFRSFLLWLMGLPDSTEKMMVMKHEVADLVMRFAEGSGASASLRAEIRQLDLKLDELRNERARLHRGLVETSAEYREVEQLDKEIKQLETRRKELSREGSRQWRIDLDGGSTNGVLLLQH
jgi:hypothetical protein